MTAQREMPKYKDKSSVADVHALRIKTIQVHEDGSATITPEDAGYGAFKTKPGWYEMFKGCGSDLGVYVVYPNGWTSWLPTDTFLEGYDSID